MIFFWPAFDMLRKKQLLDEDIPEEFDLEKYMMKEEDTTQEQKEINRCTKYQLKSVTFLKGTDFIKNSQYVTFVNRLTTGEDNQAAGETDRSSQWFMFKRRKFS